MSIQKLTILGSTGSIGANTLDVVRVTNRFEVYALSANTNTKILLQQCIEFNPKIAVLVNENLAEDFNSQLVQAGCDTELKTGVDALDEIAENSEVDIVMASIVGSAGLKSSLAAVQSGKKILLANKEALVMMGELFMQVAEDSGSTIIPIDSEHNAIFQCLPDTGIGIQESQFKYLEKVILTASGGPFLDLPLSELREVTPQQACAHPKWEMGEKISVDSATMMNKGLEFIEAHYLFGLDANKIEVLIHPQSIIHSLVYFDDGSVLAQMANPDMRVPIAYGLAYPERLAIEKKTLDLVEIQKLEFRRVDESRFPCFRLGVEALKEGGTAPVTLNAANEVAVEAFLSGKIEFMQIPAIIESVLSEIPCEAASSLAIIQHVDMMARKLSNELILKEL
ncbi:MAG: 1-deoxy-D-xylulose-5-phosphate reductoisomerase [Gammaproteobacteria bacterium]|nr:1-deoxy-D-xylulose-5-phosphate reductoisomerase [Gammaproteobacteria bacterium]